LKETEAFEQRQNEMKFHISAWNEENLRKDSIKTSSWKGSLPMKIPRTIWEYQTFKTQFGRANDISLGGDLIIRKIYSHICCNAPDENWHRFRVLKS
jgi:hypothetical protein